MVAVNDNVKFLTLDFSWDGGNTSDGFGSSGGSILDSDNSSSSSSNCGHLPCYETSNKEGREALELKPMGAHPDLAKEWLRMNDTTVTRN